MMSGRDQRRLVDITRRAQAMTTSPTLPPGAGRAPPMGELGKATADVAAMTLGTFTLQEGRPDVIGDASETRQAFALAPVTSGDLVVITPMVGKASQGFRIAQGLGEGGGDIQDQIEALKKCICLLAQIIGTELDLDAETLARIVQDCDFCSPPLTECHTCMVPSTIRAVLATFVNPGLVNVPRPGGGQDVNVDIPFDQLNERVITVLDLENDELNAPFCCFQDLDDLIQLPITFQGQQGVYEDVCNFQFLEMCFEHDDLNNEYRFQYQMVMTIPLQDGFGPPDFLPYVSTLFIDKQQNGEPDTEWFPCGAQPTVARETLLASSLFTQRHFRENVGGGVVLR